MNEVWFERIEKYINGEMSADEKSAFESELSTNKELKAMYNTQNWLEAEMFEPVKGDENEPALKNTLEGLRVQYRSKVTPADQSGSLWQNFYFKIGVSVAASVLVFVLVYTVFFNRAQDPKQVAENYINSNLTEISQTMSRSQDSLQQGIAAYNAKNYNRALQLFQEVSAKNPANRDAKQYTGYVYLITKDYEKALLTFDQLTSLQGKFNRGKFLKATTLFQRNKEGDDDQARQLLQEVVKDNAGGEEEAKEWLEKFKSKE